MNAAIDVLREQGADVQTIPALAPQLGTCVSFPPPAGCSTVLMYGQKRDLNTYLAATPGAPMHSLTEIIAFNSTYVPPMKYGQAIFEAADMLDTSPGSADTAALSRRSRGGSRAVARRAGCGVPRVRRDPRLGEQLCRHAREGGLPEHHRTWRVPAARWDYREPIPVRRDVLGSGVLGAAPDRPGVCVRAGDPPPPAACEHAAAAGRHGAAAVTRDGPDVSCPLTRLC